MLWATDSSFLFLANLHYIDILFQFEWMNIFNFVKKQKTKKTTFYSIHSWIVAIANPTVINYSG